MVQAVELHKSHIEIELEHTPNTISIRQIDKIQFGALNLFWSSAMQKWAKHKSQWHWHVVELTHRVNSYTGFFASLFTSLNWFINNAFYDLSIRCSVCVWCRCHCSSISVTCESYVVITGPTRKENVPTMQYQIISRQCEFHEWRQDKTRQDKKIDRDFGRKEEKNLYKKTNWRKVHVSTSSNNNRNGWNLTTKDVCEWQRIVHFVSSLLHPNELKMSVFLTPKPGKHIVQVYS